MAENVKFAYQSQAGIEEACRYWQRQLRLEDWDFVILMQRINELGSDATACVTYAYPNKTALIKILDPRDYHVDICRPYDMEGSLVHEILHVRLAECEPSDPAQHKVFEQAIQQMSQCLVALNRGERR